MFVFGVDVPLVEIVLGILIVTIVILIQVIVVLAMLIRQLNKKSTGK